MLNFYSSNYVQVKKHYNQINIEKISKQINNNRERASSINMDKVKIKSKIMPTANSLNKKNTTLKTISVNKQIQYKKKTPIKNQNNQIKADNNFFTSYNGVSNVKDISYNNKIKMTKNPSINNLNKNMRIAQGKSGSNNYSNNKLRRKMILSVDLKNKNNNIKNISQINDINNNLKLITDTHIENNKNIENNSNSFNNNTSNPTSNGAKTNNTNINLNNSIKPKTISVNHQKQNRSNNAIIKSPEKKYNSNIFSNCVGVTDKKGRNQKNNIGINKSNNNNKKINLQIKQPLKLFEENNSMNLTTSGNYQVNFTNSNNNEKKYIKPNLKNSNTFYKLNHNNNHTNYEINNYKLIKEVLELQVELDKNIKDNPTNSKSKKYNNLKHAFENLLKLLSNTVFKNNNIINTFFEKILIGYHEVVSAFSLENRKLKQVNYNLNEQYEKMSKDLFNSSKMLKEKQKQIENLQKIINKLENEISKEKNILRSKNNINLNSQNNKNNNNINTPKIKTEQNDKILKLNKNNLEDLDALYFYDKVKMNQKRSISIPKILIKQQEEQDEEEEEEKYEEEYERSKTIKRSSINGEFLSLNDLKFKSNIFIKLRDAFI